MPPAVTIHAYDPQDRHVFQQDAAGRWIEYEYDAAGRLVAERSPDLELEYRYDAVGNRTVVIDARGETVYA